MKNHLQIVYEEHLTVSESDLKLQLEKEEGISINTDLTPLKKAEPAKNNAAELQAMMAYKQEQLAKTNGQRFTFSYDGEIVVYEREQYAMPLGEWIRITAVGEMEHYYLNSQGQAVRAVTPLRGSNDDEWQHRVRTMEETDIRKNILGYDCHLQVIELEERNAKLSLHNHHRFELYVTPELQLPAWAVILLPATEANGCALEIKTIRLDAPNSYSLKTAIAIEQHVAPSVFVLPEQYTDATDLLLFNS